MESNPQGPAGLKRTVQPAKLVLVERSLTQRCVAEKIGVSEAFLGRILNGLQSPSARLRRQLSAFLGLPERELFRGDGGGAK